MADEVGAASEEMAAGCPDSATLAALADGSLPDGPPPSLAQHLLRCALCRAVAVGLASAAGRSPEDLCVPAAGTTGSDEASVATPASAPRRRWWPLLLVAALLLAMGAWLWLRRGRDSQPGAAPAVAAPALEQVVADLVKRQPALLEGFRLLDHAALAARPGEAPQGPLPHGGGIDVIGPRAVVLSTKPRFRWKPSGRAQVHTLELKGADGHVAWTQRIDGVGAAFPADQADLPRGSAWRWSVSAKRSTGPVTGSLEFRVASAAEAERFEAAERAIRAAAPAVADLLLAHFALRQDLLEEAERAAEAYAEAHPGDAAGAEVRAHVRARLGLEERGP